MSGEPTLWTGYYYDGRTADRRTVTVSLDPAGLRLTHTDGSSIVWTPADIRQTQGTFASEQLRIEYGSDPVEALFVDEPGFARAVRRAFPQARSVRGQRSTARLLAWGLGTLAAGVAFYIWGAPVAAGWLALRVPPDWEISLGQGVMQRMAPRQRQCGDSASLADLRQVLDRLLDAGPAHPYEFQIAVVRDTVVNAFAAPGGFIVVHSGLLHAARTPEEVAGVLAHEIQHVTQQHSTRAMIREVPLKLALSTITGGGGLETAASIAGSLGVLRYRRGDEAEADREGMRLLQAARVDPSGMVSFMETLESQRASAPRLVSYLSSHPRTADRVAELRTLAAEARYEPRPLLDSASWERLRHMCESE